MAAGAGAFCPWSSSLVLESSTTATSHLMVTAAAVAGAPPAAVVACGRAARAFLAGPTAEVLGFVRWGGRFRPLGAGDALEPFARSPGAPDAGVRSGLAAPGADSARPPLPWAPGSGWRAPREWPPSSGRGRGRACATARALTFAPSCGAVDGHVRHAGTGGWTRTLAPAIGEGSWLAGLW